MIGAAAHPDANRDRHFHRCVAGHAGDEQVAVNDRVGREVAQCLAVDAIAQDDRALGRNIARLQQRLIVAEAQAIVAQEGFHLYTGDLGIAGVVEAQRVTVDDALGVNARCRRQASGREDVEIIADLEGVLDSVDPCPTRTFATGGVGGVRVRVLVDLVRRPQARVQRLLECPGETAVAVGAAVCRLVVVGRCRGEVAIAQRHLVDHTAAEALVENVAVAPGVDRPQPGGQALVGDVPAPAVEHFFVGDIGGIGVIFGRCAAAVVEAPEQKAVLVRDLSCQRRQRRLQVGGRGRGDVDRVAQVRIDVRP